MDEIPGRGSSGRRGRGVCARGRLGRQNLFSRARRVQGGGACARADGHTRGGPRRAAREARRGGRSFGRVRRFMGWGARPPPRAGGAAAGGKINNEIESNLGAGEGRFRPKRGEREGGRQEKILRAPSSRPQKGDPRWARERWGRMERGGSTARADARRRGGGGLSAARRRPPPAADTLQDQMTVPAGMRASFMITTIPSWIM